MQGSGSLIYLGILALAFYLLIIRPQMQRSKQMRELLAALSIGDEVVTVGGLHGSITGMTEKVVTLRVADGVELVFDKSAIGQRIVADEDLDSAVETESGTAPDDENDD